MARIPVLATALVAVAAAATAAEVPQWRIPTAVRTLDNGLTVVVSQDTSSPTFGLSIVYDIGFRLEPRGRTGFAHLFEHMMFEGTPNSPKGVFTRVVEGGGGQLNGSTRLDYTNYIATAPVSALAPILWLEADRMRRLDFSPANLANQQEVVKEEVRVNVHNRPYGIFYWTDLAALAFDKWENAHDGYGSFADLDAATLADVEAFHRTYYAPNNAVLAIAGDVEPAAAFALVEKYFGGVPAQPHPAHPDVFEPANTQPRALVQSDDFARVPALAVGWKMPSPDSPDYLPAAVLAEILAGGEASRFYQRFVKQEETLLDVAGGLNWPLGSFLTADGPTLTVIFAPYRPGGEAAALVAALQAEVDGIAAGSIPAEELERTRTKMLSDHFSGLEPLLSRADLLAVTQLFRGDAGAINEVPARLAAVTAADLARVAGRYFTAANRSHIDRRPAAAAAAAGEEASR